MSWYWIDIVIVTIVLLSVLTGLFRGFIKESIALGIWIFAFWFAFHYGSILNPWISPYVHDPMMCTIVEFIIILVACLVGGGLINLIIGLLVRQSGLSGIDRLLGMGFGFVRGVLIVAMMMVGMQVAKMPVDRYKKESQLYDKFMPIVNWMSAHVPLLVQNVDKMKSIPDPALEAARSQ